MDQVSQRTSDSHASEHLPTAASAADFHASELAARITRLIRARTGNGINDLRVDVNNQSIVIAGRCSTFYCRQLAQQAAIQLGGQRAIRDQVLVSDGGDDI